MRSDKLKTFCPLPWTHISANPEGLGRVCCNGELEYLKGGNGGMIYWKNSEGLSDYFNTKSYKEIRQKMLKGKRPTHCQHCFKQEDHGVQSIRQQFLKEYQDDIKDMIQNTNEDGSISHPKITYVDMALGNNCNLQCRMCTPWSSYIIGQDWKKMGIAFDEHSAKRIFEDKYFSSKNSLQMIKEALPHVKAVFLTGGEPMLIREHFDLLEMIVQEGHAGHILIRYNSNQTVIPKRLIQIWKHFKKIVFNCSIEAYGELNSYIRYPSQWEKQVKNIYKLDSLAAEEDNIELYVHTTLQAYNILKLPDFLDWLRYENFQSLVRFPFFIWVKIPEWVSPSVLPQQIRELAADRILENLSKNEEFFLNYNPIHRGWMEHRIPVLKELCKMIKQSSDESRLKEFVEMTKKHDRLRKQSILKLVPELKPVFD